MSLYQPQVSIASRDAIADERLEIVALSSNKRNIPTATKIQPRQTDSFIILAQIHIVSYGILFNTEHYHKPLNFRQPDNSSVPEYHCTCSVLPSRTKGYQHQPALGQTKPVEEWWEQYSQSRQAN